MIRGATMVMLFALTAGGAGPQENAAQPPSSGIKNEVKGLELFMHEYSPTQEARRPTVSVRAERGTREQDGSVWTLEGTRAIFFDKDGETMTITAAHGVFDEAKQVARLTGGAHAEAGEMAFDVDDVEWNNESGEAITHGPAKVKFGRSILQTTGLVVRPKDQSFLCQNMRGRIVFAEELP